MPLIFVKPRFEVYKDISRHIRSIFAEHTPLIEPLSLDEAYLDVTENLQDIPFARDIALQIRAKIKSETDLNASAGISYNKFLAKLASDHRKPNGQYVITPEMGQAFVETLPVGKFHGIGPATAARLDSFGIHTGLDLRNQTLDFLESNFGNPARTIISFRAASTIARSAPIASANPSGPKIHSLVISQSSTRWPPSFSRWSTRSGGTAKLPAPGAERSRSKSNSRISRSFRGASRCQWQWLIGQNSKMCRSPCYASRCHCLKLFAFWACRLAHFKLKMF
jgi:hypothetical protein